MVNDQAAISPLRVLIIDDEINILITLAACLEMNGHKVTSHTQPQAALVEAANHVFDLIFLDLRLGNENGLDYIGPLLAFNPRAKIIVITAYASVETAVEAMRLGATDYLPKPFAPAQVELVTRSVAERRRLELKIESLQAVLGNDPDADFETGNAQMQCAFDMVRQVAASKAPVLICGEVGTGKSHLARAVHAWSPRGCAVGHHRLPHRR